jgi:hypothetical protein
VPFRKWSFKLTATKTEGSGIALELEVGEVDGFGAERESAEDDVGGIGVLRLTLAREGNYRRRREERAMPKCKKTHLGGRRAWEVSYSARKGWREDGVAEG